MAVGEGHCIKRVHMLYTRTPVHGCVEGTQGRTTGGVWPELGRGQGGIRVVVPNKTGGEKHAFQNSLDW